MLYIIGSIVFSLWVLFFNGAEKLENSVFGYLEFGRFAESEAYIRIAAWFGLVISSILLLLHFL